MRSPEQIAADLENMAEQYARPSYPFLADADALLREAAEALRSLARQNRDDVMALGEACEAEAERDALIAWARELDERPDSTPGCECAECRAWRAVPEPLRQRIESDA